VPRGQRDSGRYELGAGETAGDKRWQYEGQTRHTVVAFQTHRLFMPTPTYTSRLDTLDNAGLVLSQVTTRDSGNNSVEVHVFDGAGAAHGLLRRSISLIVQGKDTQRFRILSFELDDSGQWQLSVHYVCIFFLQDVQSQITLNKT
jgi:hypothetical protein